jgi:hypothetical protein
MVGLGMGVIGRMGKGGAWMHWLDDDGKRLQIDVFFTLLRYP